MKNYIDSFMRYRFLLVELVKKGIKLKYRRSYLGLIWTLLEPLLTMIVLTFVFGSMLGSKGGVYGPELYPVYILCGRLLYSCFSSASKIGMRSIRSNQAMIKKVYVPKYLYPLSSVIYNYVIFLLSLIVLAIVGVVRGIPLTWHIIEIVIPVFVLLGESIFTSSMEINMLIYSSVFSVVALIISVIVFKKNQDRFILYI